MPRNSKSPAKQQGAATAASPVAGPSSSTSAKASASASTSTSTSTSSHSKAKARGSKMASNAAPAGAAQTPPATPTPSTSQQPSSTKAGKRSAKAKAKAQAQAAELAVTSTLTSGDSSSLPWSAVIDADVGNQPVVFSSDGDFYFTASGSSIRIHSRQTGLVVSTLSSPSSGSTRHTAPVSALFLNPSNPLQLVTASLDGTVKVWDYLDARLLKSVFLGLPIQYAAMHAKHRDTVFVAVRKPKAQPNGEQVDPFNYDGKVNSIIYSASLTTASNRGNVSNPHLLKPKELARVGKTRFASGLEISPDGRWLVLIGNRKVQVASLSPTGIRQGFVKFTTDAALTALAFHPDPDNGTFATGDVQGKIRVWYFLRGEDGSGVEQIRMQTNGAEKRVPSTVLHWHAHAVSSLRFSPLGSHLLSGGEEGVLVLWQLATQGKEFVPRLGAPISSIAIAGGTESSDGEVVVRLADGSTSFISAASLRVSKSFSGSKIDVTRRQIHPSKLWKIEQPLAIQPATGHLVVTSSHPSTLQFVDVTADRLIREVEVTPSNRVSRPDETPLEPTRVERVDFFANAKGRAEWMVTLDARRSTSHGRHEVSQHLKFWRWEGKTEKYVLNTRVEAPHGAPVVAMRFSSRAVDLPTSGAGGEAIISPLLLTAGLDGQIKVWRIATSSIKGGRTSSYWIVRSSFGYRDSVPSDVAWAPDSSLFAVAQGTFVTIWDTRSNVLRRLVCAPSTAAPRVSGAGSGGGANEVAPGGASAAVDTPNESRHILFGGRGGRYLFMSSSKALCVWDLVLGQMAWEKTLATDSNVRNSRLAKAGGGDDILVVSTLESKRVFGSEGNLKRSQEAKRTRIELFDPATPSPKKVWNVPLAIREVRVVKSAAAGAGTAGAVDEDPTLLAITESHDVILLGTALGAGVEAQKAGDEAQSLSGISIARRTLFDDLFGPSSAALRSADGTVEETSQQAGAATVSLEKGAARGLFGLFEAPAHLLPPLESLFGEFVEGILPKRKDLAEKVEDKGARRKEDDVERDADDMEAEAEAKELEREEADRERKVREAAQTEMETIGAWDVQDLVGLFKGASLGGAGAGSDDVAPSSVKKAGKKPNGSTPLVNGHGAASKPSPSIAAAAAASTPKASGHVKPSTGSAKKGKAGDGVTPASTPTPTSSGAGKKRKSLSS